MTTAEKDVVYTVQPGGKLTGRARMPGDKSISHRSIMLGALAEGITDVTGFLEAEDCLCTMAAFRAMGVHIDGPEQGRVVIQGVGLHGLKAPQKALYLGNSGTSMRLLSGLLSGQVFDIDMTGDASLSKRPMKRVTQPLRLMGADLTTTPTGTPPMHIKGGRNLRGMNYTMPMASAQVKSSLLLAGLYANGKTCITEPAPTRDHTERMLQGFGYAVERHNSTVCVEGGGMLRGTKIDVPADISSAAFFMVGASIATGSDLTLEHVGINPTRIGVINILRAMGADITLQKEQVVGGEPVADIRVRAAPLRGIAIPADQVPLAIDEFPVLFIAAACAQGTTILTGAEELRIKESDRIQSMAEGLLKLGIDAKPTSDGMIIQGGKLTGGVVNSFGDHRIAMAFSIAALRSSAAIVVHDCANVTTSFPSFVSLARSVGLDVNARVTQP